MYERALRGYEDALGYEDVEKHRSALNTMENLGNLYRKQGERSICFWAVQRSISTYQSHNSCHGPFLECRRYHRAAHEMATPDSGNGGLISST
ncbi:uncharacterized protein BDR25DRAFT_358916 [Lindgomyces ingoldianus]|uniref:Uncharacterized protein n=1 Tax=Lindgomyces ingoldianus TaxID=673940 RepID=A0ACB6QIS3_9PLEO|nr:uncharacterized protein BDR25DRAFT_358916 [Lindgomyces ingoldianus]KAF2466854.1 hypothetical protein BDR25DRAFT_358916 [Lindgomyces ingoldianus]